MLHVSVIFFIYRSYSISCIHFLLLFFFRRPKSLFLHAIDPEILPQIKLLQLSFLGVKCFSNKVLCVAWKILHVSGRFFLVALQFLCVWDNLQIFQVRFFIQHPWIYYVFGKNSSPHAFMQHIKCSCKLDWGCYELKSDTCFVKQKTVYNIISLTSETFFTPSRACKHISDDLEIFRQFHKF